MAVWLVALCAVIVVYEQIENAKNIPRMQTHVSVIADALWNLDPSGAKEYLTLAAEFGNDEWITITDENGKTFLRVDGPEPRQIDNIFLSIGLIRSQVLVEPIIRQDKTIGHLSAKHRHTAIYLYLYTFVVLGLMFMVYLLFLRLVSAKRNLAARVASRTAALVETNEEVLREKGFSDDVIEGLPGMFLLYDETGKIVKWNRAVLNVTGYTTGELTRKKPTDLFNEQDQPSVTREFETAVALGGSYLEADVFTKRETQVPYYFSIVRIELDDETYIMWVGVDVTERKQAEREAAHFKDQLHQSQKMEAVGQLAGGVAHDFNNLLTAIIGNAELLKISVPPDSADAGFAEEIVTASSRASDLTKQLLAFSRKGKIQAVAVDLHSIVDEVLVLLERSIEKRIEIVQHLDASPAVVIGDSTQLQSAILNLAVNGRDAMHGKGTLTITTKNVIHEKSYCVENFEEIPPGAYIELVVADTGIGMDDEAKAHAFEPFFTTKEQGKGTGLGLAGVYGCVRDHQGIVSIFSEPGKGCMFKVLLPLAIEAVAEAPTGQPSRTAARGHGHILVVDDEETVRRFVQNALTHLGYNVSCCRDGQETIELYSQLHEEIDLVILDMMMPKLGGEETFYELKKIDRDVRVLLVSGFTRNSKIDSLINSGALGFLSKPYSIGELAHELAKHLPSSVKPC